VVPACGLSRCGPKHSFLAPPPAPLTYRITNPAQPASSHDTIGGPQSRRRALLLKPGQLLSKLPQQSVSIQVANELQPARGTHDLIGDD